MKGQPISLDPDLATFYKNHIAYSKLSFGIRGLNGGVSQWLSYFCFPSHIPPVLSRLGIDTENWLYLSQHFESPFKSLVGSAISIRQACQALGKCWVHGIQQCERLFAVPDG